MCNSCSQELGWNRPERQIPFENVQNLLGGNQANANPETNAIHKCVIHACNNWGGIAPKDKYHWQMCKFGSEDIWKHKFGDKCHSQMCDSCLQELGWYRPETKRRQMPFNNV